MWRHGRNGTLSRRRRSFLPFLRRRARTALIAPTSLRYIILRNMGGGDSGGGYEEEWEEVGSFAESITARRLYSRTSLERLEQAGTRSATGPGVQEKEISFFRFFSSRPSFLKNDRIRDTETGTEYSVQHIRPYALTLQVDVEVVV